MEDKREQIPAQEQGELIEQMQEPVQEPAQEPAQETAQETAQEPVREAEQSAEQRTDAQAFAAEAQQIFDADKSQKDAAQKQSGTYAYRWNYEDQRTADMKDQSSKRTHRRGLLVYALTMTAVFALCFGILVGVLIYDALTPPAAEQVVIGGFTGDVTVVGGGEEQTIEVSALESVRNYTVVISVKTPNGVSTGTGIVLTEDGYIATNYHVVEKAQTVTVEFYGGQAAEAEVIGYSEIDDIAVIKVNAIGLYCAVLGSSAEVKDAQNVYAVGTPAGEEYAWSVTKGVVSFAKREVKIYNDEGTHEKTMKLIQTDTPVNPGNSGGPLVNADGEVLGIITMKLSGQYENMGFAIPIDEAMILINNIIETGEPGESPITTRAPKIGITCTDVTAGTYYPDLGYSAPYTGVLVISTTPGLDAEHKLQPGDIIVMADGQAVSTSDELIDIINSHYGGETVKLTFYRNRVAKEEDIVLGYMD